MLIFSEPEHDTIDLSLDFYGYEDCTPSYAFGPAIRDNYVLHYIAKGKGYFSYKGKNILLQQGDLFLLLPNEITFYQADAQDPWSYYWLGISGTKAADYFNLTELSQTAIFHSSHPDQTSNLARLMRDTIYFSETNPPNDNKALYLYSKIYQLLFLLSQLSPNLSRTSRSEKESIYLKAKHYLDRNYQKNISIQALADELSINRSYLSVLFKQFASKSPKEYLTQVRMNRAKQLLIHTNESVKAIAFSVGYQDPLVFSKAYKQFHGFSPRQTQKQTQMPSTE